MSNVFCDQRQKVFKFPRYFPKTLTSLPRELLPGGLIPWIQSLFLTLVVLWRNYGVVCKEKSHYFRKDQSDMIAHNYTTSKISWNSVYYDRCKSMCFLIFTIGSSFQSIHIDSVPFLLRQNGNNPWSIRQLFILNRYYAQARE